MYGIYTHWMDLYNLQPCCLAARISIVANFPLMLTLAVCRVCMCIWYLVYGRQYYGYTTKWGWFTPILTITDTTHAYKYIKIIHRSQKVFIFQILFFFSLCIHYTSCSTTKGWFTHTYTDMAGYTRKSCSVKAYNTDKWEKGLNRNKIASWYSMDLSAECVYNVQYSNNGHGIVKFNWCMKMGKMFMCFCVSMCMCDHYDVWALLKFF